MAFTKYASLEQSQILEVKGTDSRIREASIEKLADFEDYRTEDGYLYARIRAISSRVNKNHDGWPSVQLAGGDEAWESITANRTSSEGFTVEANDEEEYGYSTFIGKPIFVDHHNSNPKKARGVIVDSKFRVLDQRTASEDSYWGGDAHEAHMPPVEVELLLEVDAKSFPRLAKAIVSGDIDGFSMGCDVNMSKCSVCENEARSPGDYCLHVKQKGAEFDHVSSDGTKTSKKAYEDCYGIRFFEISAVFDPADETALAREIISKVATEATPQFGEGEIAINRRGPQKPTKIIEQDPNSGYYLVQSPEGGMARYVHPDDLAPGDMDPNAAFNDLPVQGQTPLPDFKQWPTTDEPPAHPGGSIVSKTADAPPPQSEMTKAPQSVDTLREEKVCPVCGSDIDGTKCDICQFVPPPDGLDNPDLAKARTQDEDSLPGELGLEEDSSPNVPGDPLAEKPAPGDASATSYLRARNTSRTARVTSEMAWDPEITPRLAAVLEADTTPSEEPTEEVVTRDETAPTTATVEAADAAGGSDTSPSKRVDVEGVGGFIDDSNEAASAPEGPQGQPGVTVDVEGKGGIIQDSNEEASKPDEKQDVSNTADDNAGFNKDKTTEDSGPTKTYPNKNQQSPVTDKVFTGAAEVEAAKKGTDPIDPAGKADKRVDVEDSSQFKTKGTDTDQWTGTDGNGVTKQQNPVTPKVGPGNDVKSSSVFRALKLADTEVKLGLTSEDDKYNRIAELAELSTEEFKAAATVVARVKTAGLAKRQARTAHAVPNLQQAPRTEPVQKEASSDIPDEAIFTR